MILYCCNNPASTVAAFSIIILKLLLIPRITINVVDGLSKYLDLIPNGHRIPHPCNRSLIWLGVGHENPEGNGSLNWFGRDFATAKNRWTTSLCNFDSDGDGRTNGEELGDPNCQFVAGDEFIEDDNLFTKRHLGHPGICEPLTSAACRERNAFLQSLDECEWVFNSNYSKSWCPALDDDNNGIKQLTIRLNRTRVPANDTSHLCQEATLPSDDNYQIVAWEPIAWIFDVTYQMVMFICDDATELAKLPRKDYYKTPVRCPLIPLGCRSFSLIWTRGAPLSRCYAEKGSGVPFGKNYYSKIVLQIRYDNPRLKATYYDQSGYILYYKKLLGQDTQKNVGTIVIGQRDIALPPHSPVRSVTSTGFSGNCSQSKLQQQSSRNSTYYKILSLTLRTNQAGVYAKVYLRKKNQMNMLLERSVYFDKPPRVLFQPPATTVPDLEPGDSLIVECRYSTSERDEWTFYGEETSYRSEICYAVFELFPLPNGKMSQLSIDSGRYDSCTLQLQTDDDNRMINECNLTSFRKDFVEKINKTDFEKACACRGAVYPVTACSLNCYNFLMRRVKLSPSITACLKDVPLFASFDIFADHSLSYNIQSQVAQCLQVKKAPIAGSAISCNNNKKPFEHDYYDDNYFIDVGGETDADKNDYNEQQGDDDSKTNYQPATAILLNFRTQLKIMIFSLILFSLLA